MVMKWRTSRKELVIVERGQDKRNGLFKNIRARRFAARASGTD